MDKTYLVILGSLVTGIVAIVVAFMNGYFQRKNKLDELKSKRDIEYHKKYIGNLENLFVILQEISRFHSTLKIKTIFDSKNSLEKLEVELSIISGRLNDLMMLSELYFPEIDEECQIISINSLDFQNYLSQTLDYKQERNKKLVDENLQKLYSINCKIISNVISAKEKLRKIIKTKYKLFLEVSLN